MAKRGVKSPDRAEALMLAFAAERRHGLLQLWREQAEAIKSGQAPHRTEPQDLAQAQKGAATWKQSPKRLGQVAPAVPQTERCPKCENGFLGRYSHAWRCNVCEESGQDGIDGMNGKGV